MALTTVTRLSGGQVGHLESIERDVVERDAERKIDSVGVVASQRRRVLAIEHVQIANGNVVEVRIQHSRGGRVELVEYEGVARIAGADVRVSTVMIAVQSDEPGPGQG